MKRSLTGARAGAAASAAAAAALLHLGLAALVGVGALLTTPRTARAQVVTTVMSGLDNPRGLAIGPEGALYVTEAGRGGDAVVVVNGGNYAYGFTGAVSRLWKGNQERFATGLPSFRNPMGDVGGPNDISFQGRGGAYVTTSLGANPAIRSAFGPFGALLGSLLHVPASGKWRVAADVAAHEGANNPAGGPVDSNPFGLLAQPGGRVLTDAGANALLRVGANGDVATLAVFPARPARNTDSVPTSVVVGPDGAYYVGELTGVPFAPGAANVYRVPAGGGAPTVYQGGFTTIIDLAFAPDGSLYVLQHATGAIFFGGPGEIVRVPPGGGAPQVVYGGLERPTAIALGDDGAIYVTNKGLSIGDGRVLKLEF